MRPQASEFRENGQTMFKPCPYIVSDDIKHVHQIEGISQDNAQPLITFMGMSRVSLQDIQRYDQPFPLFMIPSLHDNHVFNQEEAASSMHIVEGQYETKNSFPT